MDGTLPPGRWGATFDEVRETFVSGRDPVRGELWDEFNQAVDLLRSAVMVSRVWMFGSFISGKTNPSDVDAVFVIREDHVAAIANRSAPAQIVQLYAGQHLLESVTGLRVDAYTLPWRINPQGAAQCDLDRLYQQRRGYWDDWLERKRSSSRTSPLVESDAHQRRGYVEVIIDGNK